MVSPLTRLLVDVSAATARTITTSELRARTDTSRVFGGPGTDDGVKLCSSARHRHTRSARVGFDRGVEMVRIADHRYFQRSLVPKWTRRVTVWNVVPGQGEPGCAALHDTSTSPTVNRWRNASSNRSVYCVVVGMASHQSRELIDYWEPDTESSFKIAAAAADNACDYAQFSNPSTHDGGEGRLTISCLLNMLVFAHRDHPTAGSEALLDVWHALLPPARRTAERSSVSWRGNFLRANARR